MFEGRYDKPLMEHLGDPQDLNSYSYVANRSLTYTDPTGEITTYLGPDVQVGPYGAGFGVAIDGTGVAFYYSTSVGYGAGLKLFELTSDNIPQDTDVEVSRGGGAVVGGGFYYRKESPVNLDNTIRLNSDAETVWSTGAGLQYEASQEYTHYDYVSWDTIGNVVNDSIEYISGLLGGGNSNSDTSSNAVE